MSSANSLGVPFIELHRVESTNNYAMGLIYAGMAQHGMAVFAHEQTKGKGQREKQWHSAAKENILLSLIINPFGLKTDQLFLLSMCVAVALRNFFAFYAQDNTKIKWPNDIYWCDRKAGGILIENVIRGHQWKYAIIGIGLNINQTDFGEFDKAISLSQVSGKTYHTVEMAKKLLAFLAASFKNLQEDEENLVKTYHQHLYKLNEKVCLKKNEQVFEAVITGVTKEGMLLVQHEKEEAFSVGEVEWV